MREKHSRIWQMARMHGLVPTICWLTHMSIFARFCRFGEALQGISQATALAVVVPHRRRDPQRGRGTGTHHWLCLGSETAFYVEANCTLLPARLRVNGSCVMHSMATFVFHFFQISSSWGSLTDSSRRWGSKEHTLAIRRHKLQCGVLSKQGVVGSRIFQAHTPPRLGF